MDSHESHNLHECLSKIPQTSGAVQVHYWLSITELPFISMEFESHIRPALLCCILQQKSERIRKRKRQEETDQLCWAGDCFLLCVYTWKNTWKPFYIESSVGVLCTYLFLLQLVGALAKYQHPLHLPRCCGGTPSKVWGCPLFYQM